MTLNTWYNSWTIVLNNKGLLLQWIFIQFKSPVKRGSRDNTFPTTAKFCARGTDGMFIRSLFRLGLDECIDETTRGFTLVGFHSWSLSWLMQPRVDGVQLQADALLAYIWTNMQRNTHQQMVISHPNNYRPVVSSVPYLQLHTPNT